MTDIIYVDKDDTVIGSGTIKNAIENGIIRRVSRILIFNAKGDVLLQRRGDTISYPGLWNDSASGHVDVGETYMEAALREMKEEMGIKGVTLTEVGKFYGEELDGALIRKAFNTLYTGVFNGTLTPDPHEVSETKWISVVDLQKWIEERPHDFTPGSVAGFTLYFASPAGMPPGAS